MATRLIFLFASSGLLALGFLIRWVAARVGVLVDEMTRQDYPSVAGKLGDWVLWLAARRTPDPHVQFEAWLADLDEERFVTGNACLGSALWTFATAGKLVSPPAATRSAVQVETTGSVGSLDGGQLPDELFELWIDAEIARRGGTLTRAAINSAVIVMEPGRDVEVRLNDEAGWTARVVARSPFLAGQVVSQADIDVSMLSDFRPVKVDPNAGWTGFTTVAGQVVTAFDFRRNRLTASDVLNRAAASLDQARDTTTFLRGRRVCLGHLADAADAAALAITLLMFDVPEHSPAQRRRFLRDQAAHGNLPQRCSEAVDRVAPLLRAGPTARVLLRRCALRRLHDDLLALVDVARISAGH